MIKQGTNRTGLSRVRVLTVVAFAVAGIGLFQASGASAETLTVVKSPANSGTVVSSPAGINCRPSQTVCTGTFRRNAGVTLTTTPARGFYTHNWSGCDSNDAPRERSRCSVTMSRNRAVGVTFASDPTLTVGVSPREGAWISSSPIGISCGRLSDRCQASFDYGSRVTLTANLYPRWGIDYWTGSCAGSGTSRFCALTMTSSHYTTLGLKPTN